MPEVLVHTSEYLKQFLIEDDSDEDDPERVEVKPELIQNLETFANDAKEELFSKFPASFPYFSQSVSN